MATNKKITQVQLGTETYDIDVSADRKAKPLLQTEDDSDLTKVLPKSAVLKPDGTNDLFDENKKLNSHYISDTILGQLKFGGTITYNNEYPTGTHQYVITPSSSLRAHLLAKAPEGTSTLVGFSFKIKPQNFPAENWCTCTLQAYNSVPELLGQPTLYLKDFEGFYFIYKESQYTAPELKNSEQAIIVPKFEVGDWFLTCGEAIQKIDNTDTITHIDETDYNSLLEITGSSGLKLNGFSRYPDTVSISLDTDLYSASDITTTGTINAGLVSTSQVSASSIDAGEIFASNRMTAPTISDKTDKSQVVNLEYFENNATKVDWENIDSEVHVINDHNVEIDGGLVVHCNSDITRVDISSLGDEQTCAYEPYVQSDGTTNWYNDSNLTPPYWLKFPITAGYRYEVTIKPEFMNSSSFIKDEDGAGHLVVTAASEGAAINIVEYSYAASAQDVEYPTSWIGKGTIYFTADITGYAYIPTGNSVMFDNVSMYSITEIQGSVAHTKIEGDLEVTGDLSFGADSHLVFGTIEGTDFIADYAKVKNAPTEDDDVVNKAYFDANKGSGGNGLPSGATEGAFLRYKSGAAVWEVIPSAEGNTF